MSVVGEAIDEGRAAFSEIAPDVMADLCDIETPGAAANTGDGTWTEAGPTTISNVPVEYEALSAYERMNGGAVTASADHKLKFPVFWNGAHLTIPETAVVKVKARGLNPARTFSVTGPLPTSKKVTQKVAAKLI